MEVNFLKISDLGSMQNLGSWRIHENWNNKDEDTRLDLE